MEKVLQIFDLLGLRRISAECADYCHYYLVCRWRPSSHALPLEMSPMRIAGLSLCLLRDGEIDGEIDGEKFQVGPNSIVMLNSNSVLDINKIDWTKIDADLLVFSPQMLQDLNFDISSLNLHSVIEQRPNRTLSNVDSHSMEIFHQYINLLYANASDHIEDSFAKNIARSLSQAMFYQLLQLYADNTNKRIANDARQTSTQISYTQEFMRLLQIHHIKHRDVAYYAQKLCISTKYLSHIIKEATGRSASDWIAGFVVQEAKNMLRFSNKSVQQVAYELNFASQSAFGKFFKNITGLSPTEFKKT